MSPPIIWVHEWKINEPENGAQICIASAWFILHQSSESTNCKNCCWKNFLFTIWLYLFYLLCNHINYTFFLWIFFISCAHRDHRRLFGKQEIQHYFWTSGSFGMLMSETLLKINRNTVADPKFESGVGWVGVEPLFMIKALKLELMVKTTQLSIIHYPGL